MHVALGDTGAMDFRLHHGELHKTNPKYA